MLKQGDLAAGEIAERFSMTRPSISYHLDLLKQAGLVSSRKEGQFVRYSLETTVLDDSIGWILGLLTETKKHAKIRLAQKGMAANSHPGAPLHLGRRVLE